MASEKERLSLDDPGIPAERQFYTVGFLSQILGQPTHAVILLARNAGVAPAYAHNGVPTFDGKAVERMTEFMKAAVEVYAEHAEAAPNN